MLFTVLVRGPFERVSEEGIPDVQMAARGGCDEEALVTEPAVLLAGAEVSNLFYLKPLTTG